MAFIFKSTTSLSCDKRSVYCSGMKTLNEQVLEAAFLFARAKKWSQVELAEYLGESSPQTITNWKSRGLPDAKLLAVATKIGYELKKVSDILEPAGLVVESDVSDPEQVFVGRVHGARFAAGNGELVFEAEEIDRSHGFRRDYMERRGLNPARCKLFTVKGESMLPTIANGALVLVNLADREIVTGQIYALITEDGLRVKRLYRRADGLVEMRSDNPMQHLFPPEVITDGNAAVMGRVVWQAADL